jgi:hypothetical protein
MRKMWLHLCVVSVLTGPGSADWVLAASQPTSAERLARLVPEDTLAYVATSGIDELRPAFEKTVFQEFINDPNVKSVIDKVTVLVRTEFVSEANDTGQAALLQLLKSVYRRPVLAGVAQQKTVDEPGIYGYVMLDAGPSKAQITAALTAVEKAAGAGEVIEKTVHGVKVHEPNEQDDVPVYWGWVDEVLVVGVNDSQHLAIKDLTAGRSASAMPTFSRLPGAGDAIVLSVDIQKAHGLLMAMMKKEANPEALRTAVIISKELGLADLRVLTLRAGFKDRGMTFDGLLLTSDVQGPILRRFRPADLSMLDAMDPNTLTATVWNIDLPGLYDLAMQTAKAVASPSDYAEIEKTIAEAEGQLGFKIRQDLLAGLAGPAMLCGVETPGSLPASGAILVAKLTQPETVDKALALLAKIGVEKSGGQLHVGSTTVEGCTLRCVSATALGMFQIMPTWAVVKDRLVVATNSPLCERTVRQFISGALPKQPLRTTPAYRQVCGNLPSDVVGLQFTDSPRQFKLAMTQMQPFWPLVTVAASKVGLQLPVAMPRLDRIADQLPPSVAYYWREKDGLRWHYQGLSIDSPSLGGLGVAAGVAIPAMVNARTAAIRAASMSNLKQIGLACTMYAVDNNAFPPNLQTLVDKGIIQGRILQRPDGSKAVGRPYYVYVSGQNTAMDTQNILAHEDPAQSGDKVCALFLDCHVESLSHDAFQKRLEETYKRLGREMPK